MRRARGVLCLLIVLASLGVALHLHARARDLEALLSESLGTPVRVGAVRLDPATLALVLEEVRVPMHSWTLDLPQARVRVNLSALLEGRLQPSVTAGAFSLLTVAPDGPDALRRVPELLEVLGLPDARVRLEGGEVRTTSGQVLLAHMSFALDVSQELAHLSARVQQTGGGRLDVRGVIGPEGLQVDAYLDDLVAPEVAPWLARLAPGAPILPARAGSASGRWHVRVASAGEVRHDFGLELAALERRPASRPRARATVHLNGSIALGPGLGARPLLPGSTLHLRGRAEALAFVSGWLLSGPFEADVGLSGTTAQTRLLARARFDEARLRSPFGLHKPAGLPGRLSCEAGAEPGRLRFELAFGALEAEGTREPDGSLHASSRWIDTAELLALAPALRGHASGGRMRVASFAARPGGTPEATLEVEDASFSGRDLPSLRGVRGRARVGAQGLEASDVVLRVEDVPVRVERLSLLRGGAPGAPWRARFVAEAGDVVLPASDAPEPEGPLPAELRQLAEEHLLRLRDPRLAASLELEEGRLRLASLRAGASRLRDVELVLGLRDLRLELRRVAFERDGRPHAYTGSIDLRPLLPEVHLAALGRTRP